MWLKLEKILNMVLQHKYIYDENGTKMIDHVLYLENLNQEFNELMKEYDIPLELKRQKLMNLKNFMV